MKRGGLAVITLATAVAAFAPACSSGFGRIGPSASLVVNITAGDIGRPDARLPIPVLTTATYVVDIEAHKADGTTDTSFNGWVRASVKPGTVQTVGDDCDPNDPKFPNPANPPVTDGRNVQLANGVARGLKVCVAATYGDARLWFEDVGYTPADINKPPQCSDGIDNNGNGLIDFPADPGCEFANDDTEDGGTYGLGVSPPLYFLSPRVHDVRGRVDLLKPTAQGGSATNFPHEQVQLDTGWNKDTDDYRFSTIVTRIAADGFYLTDLQEDLIGVDPNLPSNPDKVPGYASVFAFTFSTPPKMRTCDRLKLLGGTASDFHGFTELGFPTWLLEEWDPTLRECMVPTPHSLTPSDLASPDAFFRLESSLVRIENANNIELRFPAHFGPGLATLMGDAATGSYVFARDASSCDFDRNGKIAFDGGPENVCSVFCSGGVDPRDPTGTKTVAGDAQCSEYSQFATQNEMELVITFHFDPMNPMNVQYLKMQVDGSSSPTFDPLSHRGDPMANQGDPVRAFTGTLRYFSGGSQWTIEARCDDDIILDLSKRPFCSDAEYDAKDAFCNTQFLTSDGSTPPIPVPPPNRLLACVHARSASDNTEQH
jgi:hypothetical protein